jgi:Fe-S cluster biogenesis protein NfuA
MSAAPSDDEVRRASERIERLLGELQGAVSPAAWTRVEELLATLTSVYGRGLGRVLEIFADAGGDGDEARARLLDDPLIASLMLLHGLHPESVEERVLRAIERVRRAIGKGAGEIEIASLDEARRRVTLSLTGSWRACPTPRHALEAALRRAIEELAPEVADTAIEGAPELASAKSELVQIDLARSRVAPAGAR